MARTVPAARARTSGERGGRNWGRVPMRTGPAFENSLGAMSNRPPPWQSPPPLRFEIRSIPKKPPAPSLDRTRRAAKVRLVADKGTKSV
jgi:hypothetical protein